MSESVPLIVPVFNFHGSKRFDMSVPTTSPWHDLFAMAKRVELHPNHDAHVRAWAGDVITRHFGE